MTIDTSTRPSATVTDDGYVARARAIAPIIEAEADKAEAEREVTQRAVDAIAEAGLFWQFVPESLGGGGGVSFPTFISTVEELTRADGSVGWISMILSLGNRDASLFLDPSTGLYTGESKAIIGGFAAPVGTAVEVDGGVRASAKRVPFGSGSTYMTHIILGVRMLDEAGEQIMLASGNPDIRTVRIPRDQVNFLGNWDVSGLVATGSYDYEVPEQFIPDELITQFGFWTEPGQPVEGYLLDSLAGGGAGHAGVALGLTKRALEEVVRITAGKARQGYPGPVDESPLFLDGLAKNDAAYRSAREYVLAIYGAAEEAAANTGQLPAELAARMRQATTHAHNVAQQVIDFAELWGGTQAFKNPSALGRVIRDFGVAKAHLFVDPISMTDAAPEILKSWKR